MKLYGITNAIAFLLFVVVAVVQGIVTANWWRLWPIGASLVVTLGLGVNFVMRRLGSRIEVTATQLRLVNGFERARSVPTAEVSSFVRGTIELGRQQKLPGR